MSPAPKQWLITGLVAGAAALAGYLVARQGMHAEHHEPAEEAALPNQAEGSAIPDLSFTDLKGQPQRLQQYTGRWLLVNFWATWCAPCMEEIPLLIKLQQRYPPQTLQVLGIAMDEPEAVTKAITELQINYPSWAGGMEINDAMAALGNGAGAVPYTLLIDPTGRIAVVELGGLSADKLDAWMQRWIGKAPGISGQQK